MFSAIFIYLIYTVAGLLHYGLSRQLFSAVLQQKACALLTHLCHRYALKCQYSHKEKIGRRGPGENGSDTSTGNLPRTIRKTFLHRITYLKVEDMFWTVASNFARPHQLVASQVLGVTRKPQWDIFCIFSKQIAVIIAILCPYAAHIYMQIFIFAHITIY